MLRVSRALEAQASSSSIIISSSRNYVKFESANGCPPRRLLYRGGTIAVVYFWVSRALEAQASSSSIIRSSSRNYVKFKRGDWERGREEGWGEERKREREREKEKRGVFERFLRV